MRIIMIKGKKDITDEEFEEFSKIKCNLIIQVLIH